MDIEQCYEYEKKVYGEEDSCKKNFYALLACILNEKLGVDGGLRYMGVSARKQDWELEELRNEQNRFREQI